MSEISKSFCITDHKPFVMEPQNPEAELHSELHKQAGEDPCGSAGAGEVDISMWSWQGMQLVLRGLQRADGLFRFRV